MRYRAGKPGRWQHESTRCGRRCRDLRSGGGTNTTACRKPVDQLPHVVAPHDEPNSACHDRCCSVASRGAKESPGDTSGGKNEESSHDECERVDNEPSRNPDRCPEDVDGAAWYSPALASISVFRLPDLKLEVDRADARTGTNEAHWVVVSPNVSKVLKPSEIGGLFATFSGD